MCEWVSLITTAGDSTRNFKIRCGNWELETDDEAAIVVQKCFVPLRAFFTQYKSLCTIFSDLRNYYKVSIIEDVFQNFSRYIEKYFT